MNRPCLLAGALALATMSSARAITGGSEAPVELEPIDRIVQLESEVARLQAAIDHLHDHLLEILDKLSTIDRQLETVAHGKVAEGVTSPGDGLSDEGTANDIEALRQEALAELADITEDATAVISPTDHSLEGHSCEHCDHDEHDHASDSEKSHDHSHQHTDSDHTHQHTGSGPDHPHTDSETEKGQETDKAVVKKTRRAI